MSRKQNILTILWLGLLSSQWVYAASCPTDSIITYDQNGVPTEKTLYAYDDAGRQTLTETQRLTNGVITSGSKTQTTYYSTGKTQMTAKWTWSTTTNNWVGNEKNEYTYNEAGKTLTWTIYNWGTDDWTNKSKYEYAYDTKNRQILSVYYVGSGSSWTPKNKSEQNYDNKGNKILDRYWSGYDAQTQTWIGSSWDAWEYNSTTSPKSPTMTEQYTWENGAWKGTSKYDYEYDAAGNQTLSRFYNIYDAATQMWSPSSENHYAYFKGDKNMRTLVEQYTWKNGEKTGVAKEEYAYDAGGNLTMTTIYEWDTTTQTFIPVSKLQIEYDEWKNEIFHEEYAIQNGKWVGLLKEEHTYTDKTYLTKEIIYLWDTTLNDWINFTRDTAAYDANKNQTLDERYTWAADTSLPEGGYWKGTKKEVSEYTNNKQTLKEIYLWVDDTRDWTYQSKVIYAYSGNNITLDEEYALVNGAFVGTKKERYAYNANGQTTLTEQYTWQNNTWVGTTKKEYAFNTVGQQTMHAYYTWKNNTWVGTEKKEQELDGEGRVILLATYQWKNNAWIGQTKTETSYFRNDMIADEATYTWQNGGWVGASRYTKVYSDEGQLMAVIYYQSASASQTPSRQVESRRLSEDEWVMTTKEEYSYTDAGVLSSTLTSTWNGTWVPATLHGSTFNEQGKVLVDSTSVHQDGRWQLTQRNTNNYNGTQLVEVMTENWQNGLQISGNRTVNNYDAGSGLLVNTTKYSWFNDHWAPISITDNVYNDKGKLLTSWSRDSVNGTWFDTQRKANEYDEAGHTLSAIVQTYSNAVQTGGTKKLNTYSGNTQTSTESYKWVNNDWVGVSKSTYEYVGDEKIESAYVWENNDWVGTTRIGYVYQGSKVISETHYYWTGSLWENDTKTEYEYSGSKNKVIATYIYEDGTWVGKSKTGSFYDEGETLTSASWTWNGTGWTPKTKSGKSTYTDGRTMSETTYKASGSDFVYNTKTVYAYGTGAKDITTTKYTWKNNAWEGVSKEGVTYLGGKLATDTVFQWVSGWDWIYSTLAEYEYGEGKDQTTAHYVWSNNMWVGVDKISQTYTDKGDPWTKYTYCWRNNDWADSLKQEHNYDERGNDTLFIDAQWKNDAWSNLATSTKWEIRYDENDSLILDAHYYWKANKNTWYGTGTKYEYQYDEQGHKILDQKSTWSGTKWIGSSKQIWAFDTDGNQTLNEYWTWDKNYNRWNGLTRSETGYDDNGKQNMTASYRWNDSKRDWQGISKKQDIYTNNSLTTSYSYVWSMNLWKWVGSYKYEYTYNEDGKTIQQLTSSFNEDNEEWYYSAKYDYFYDSKGTKFQTDKYTISNNQWILRSTEVTKYDDDSAYKMRLEKSATYTITGEPQAYSEKTYYYACDPKFTVTAVAKDDLGTVTGSGTYTYYAHVPVQAEGDSVCSSFHQWESLPEDGTRVYGDASTPSVIVVVTSDMTLTAEFTPTEHTLTAGTNDILHGSVTVTTDPPTR